ncbi:hypothetical protein B0G77_5436 [Paraburkholderia sp. BL10I2N1]|nr:hypothetical protein B0G77_5436 [Paraburkholderia sp. BL10I2N1]
MIERRAFDILCLLRAFGRAILARRPTHRSVATVQAQDLQGVVWTDAWNGARSSIAAAATARFRVHPQGRVRSVAKISLALPTRPVRRGWETAAQVRQHRHRLDCRAVPNGRCSGRIRHSSTQAYSRNNQRSKLPNPASRSQQKGKKQAKDSRCCKQSVTRRRRAYSQIRSAIFLRRLI